MTKRMSGFYTPEVAMVLLISLFAIFSLLFLGFYIHDVQVLQTEMNRLTDQAAAEDWEEEKLLWEAEGRLIGEELALMCMKVERLETKKDLGALVLVAEIKDGTIKSTVKNHSPEEFTRKTEAVKESVE